MQKLSVGLVLALVIGVTASYGWSSTVVQSSNGHGTLPNADGSKRQFSFNAKRHDDGSVTVRRSS